MQQIFSLCFILGGLSLFIVLIFNVRQTTKQHANLIILFWLIANLLILFALLGWYSQGRFDWTTALLWAFANYAIWQQYRGKRAATDS